MSKSRRYSWPPGRPRSKQPRRPPAVFRLLNGGMLVNSLGIVELESLAMKSMSHGCAREPYTYKIQMFGLAHTGRPPVLRITSRGLCLGYRGQGQDMDMNTGDLTLHAAPLQSEFDH
ncbi:hypothetical protein BKA70DRAFT_1406670 [Coprinopsis sp. MPI-PUGE-AT-0042]|nr:hypothetical protein BKA70DRAFT_1406670 [Coprinopsis sp. MPI-PUGE-AT-0042]